MSIFLTIAIGTLTLSTALVAGVFLAFSDFIMRSLAAAGPATGIAAMQEINRQIIRSVFVPLFIVLAPVSLGIAIYAWFEMEGAGLVWLCSGAAIYVVGTFAVTVFGNVPMNERLDKLPVSEAGTYWQVYLRDWVRWNHVRTFASTIAALCYLVAGLVS